jgi:hypothetical protein
VSADFLVTRSSGASPSRPAGAGRYYALSYLQGRACMAQLLGSLGAKPST